MAIIESGVNLEDRIKDLEVRNAVANLRNAATSSLAKYDLADQVIDDFQTAAGLHTAFSGYSVAHATGYLKGASNHDSNTVVFISGDGTNGTTVSNSNINSSGSYTGNWTVTSDPVFSNAQRKFNTYATSILFDDGGGTDSAMDYIESEDANSTLTAGMDTSTNKEFTMECFLYLPNSTPDGIPILGFSGNSGSWSHVSRGLHWEDASTRQVQFNTGGGPSQEGVPSGGAPSGSSISSGAWHHLCLGRHQNSNASSDYSTRLYIDGTYNAKGTASTGNLNNLTLMKFRINGNVYPNPPNSTGPNSCNIYMQDIRYSNTWRYHAAGATRGSESNFTVPTTSLASGGGGGMTAGNMVAVSLDTATAVASPVPIRGDLVIMYEDTSGTASVNTELIGYVSRDSGSTWATATLVSEGALGTSKIVAHHDIDVSGHGSARTMRYKIVTTNQDVKETRITGVALGWH